MKKLVKSNKKKLRKYLSPAFLTLLVLATILWYLTKLSYTYTSTVPMDVNIEGNKITVECVVEGSGYRLFSHKVFNKKEMLLYFNDVQTTPSSINQGYFVISPYSLQNAIAVRHKDLRIISIGNLPEITIESVNLK